MSATIEILYEEIRRVEGELYRTKNPDEAEMLKARLLDLRSQFSKANESLNENRQVLKG